MTSDPYQELLQFGPLANVPLWALFLITAAALFFAYEAGYALSKWWQRRSPDKAEANVGALSGATLGLLAFLLAFVTGAGVNILGVRRQAVVAEANAIGTTYLRAGYLSDPYGTESRELLREYVDVRLAAIDRANLAAALARSEEIHGELWAHAEVMARAESSATISLYIASLNQVIDLHTERVNAALVLQLPSALYLILMSIAVLALLLVGLHSGYAERQNLVALAAFVLALSAVFYVIMDLNRAQEGLLQVSQQAMIDLQRTISQP